MAAYNTQVINQDLRPTPREELDIALSKAFRPLFTYLTGLPAVGEEVRHRTQIGRIATAVGCHLGGIAAGAMAVELHPVMAIFTMPFAWTAAVGGARDLQLTVLHHCAHGSVISKNSSKAIGRAIASVLMIEPFDSYAQKHCSTHHGRHSVSTEADPTFQFLNSEVRIEPGDSPKQNRGRFLKALASPRFHLKMLADRVRSQFGATASWKNRVGTAACMTVLGTMAFAVGGSAGVVVGLILPMTVGYQAAQVARLMVEHRWPNKVAANGKRSIAEHDELTLAIRLAPRPPKRWNSFSTATFIRDSLISLWLRFVVLPGDSGPSHHWHHAHARGDWPNHVMAAQEWTAQHKAKGNPGPETAWSYGEALDMVLKSFAAASVKSIQPPKRRNAP